MGRARSWWRGCAALLPWGLLFCLIPGGLIAGWLIPAAASAQPDAPDAPPDAAVPDAPPAYQAPPEWRWVQVLAAPRIGARLTALATDPQNPDRVYVGSQSGVIYYTEDGAVTWRELEPDAFTANRRDVLPPRGGSCLRPDCDEIPLLFQFPGNPIRPPTNSATSLALGLLQPGVYASTFPVGFFAPTYAIRDEVPVARLLGNAIRSRTTEEVRRIVLCPGSTYPLVVATAREVVGSPDNGYSWIRLLRFSNEIETPQVACDPLRTNHLIIATAAGYQESLDGGVTIDPNLAGYPRGPVQAVTFGTDGSLYLASGFQLFKRQTNEVDARRIYPDFNNSATAPWEPILWVEPEDDNVWLGTQDGLRHSEDHGRRFETVAPNLFSRQVIPQVVVGRNESGGRRVAAIVRDCPRTAREPTSPGCRGTLVLSSDDGGRHWDPFFQGITRRSIQQMAYAQGRWYVVTGGELWMTSIARPGAVDQSIVQQAQRALQRTPTLSTVIETALDRVELNQEQVDSMIDRAYAAGWIPRRISVNFEIDVDTIAGGVDRMGLGPFTRGDDASFSFFYAWVFLEWSLPETTGSISDQGRVYREPLIRERLFRLRQQISFLVEDAWHERRIHLRRIARGFTDPYQAAVLLERIDVLEAILEFWLGAELESFAPSPRRRP